MFAQPIFVTINPYSAPQSESFDGFGNPVVPFGWNVGFWLLVVCIAIDIGIVACRFAPESQGIVSSTMSVLALIALAQSFMVFAIRWILFRLILRRRCAGDIQGFVPLAGVIVIFAMIKLIEYQGFRLWSAFGEHGKFLIFMVPGLALLASMSPRRLARFQASGPHLKMGSTDDSRIRP